MYRWPERRPPPPPRWPTRRRARTGTTWAGTARAQHDAAGPNRPREPPPSRSPPGRAEHHRGPPPDPRRVRPRPGGGGRSAPCQRPGSRCARPRPIDSHLPSSARAGIAAIVRPSLSRSSCGSHLEPVRYTGQARDWLAATIRTSRMSVANLREAPCRESRDFTSASPVLPLTDFELALWCRPGYRILQPARGPGWRPRGVRGRLPLPKTSQSDFGHCRPS